MEIGKPTLILKSLFSSSSPRGRKICERRARSRRCATLLRPDTRRDLRITASNNPDRTLPNEANFLLLEDC